MPRAFASLALFALLLTLAPAGGPALAEDKEDKEACPADCDECCAVSPALGHKMDDITGEEVALSDYAGKVVLMVNVASECGYTPQYRGLQALHEKYADEGLAVLGFPCNQFGGQEPGSNEEIAEFCQTEFGVSFPMFDKIDVNGEDAAPLYKYLTSEEVDIEDQGEVKWNFEKFLLDREGNVIARFRSADEPTGEEMVEAIETALAD